MRPPALLAACLAAALASTAARADELPIEGGYRDAGSCEAVRTLARADAALVEDEDADTPPEPLDEAERELLDDAVRNGVLLDASSVAGPGGWLCSFPQVWEVRAGDRWLALAACDGGDDFFPAVLSLERLEEERYRLRLGDGADAVDMIPCRLEPAPGQ